MIYILHGVRVNNTPLNLLNNSCLFSGWIIISPKFLEFLSGVGFSLTI